MRAPREPDHPPPGHLRGGQGDQGHQRGQGFGNINQPPLAVHKVWHHHDVYIELMSDQSFRIYQWKDEWVRMPSEPISIRSYQCLADEAISFMLYAPEMRMLPWLSTLIRNPSRRSDLRLAMECAIGISQIMASSEFSSDGIWPYGLNGQ